jgi:DNA-binding Lrp family transcriptional regulator
VIRKSRENEIEDTAKDNIGLASHLHSQRNHDNDTETEKFTKIKTNSSDVNINNYKNDSTNNSVSHFKSFIWADKLDVQIIKELLIDPSIQTFEISFKLGIPLDRIHKKRRLIENTILKKKFLIDLGKLGLDFRFADIFAQIQKDKLKNFVKELFKTPFSKNILQVLIMDGSDNICIKIMFNDSKEIFVLMDEIRSRPFISNVHFSEEIETQDNTLTVLLGILNGNRYL